MNSISIHGRLSRDPEQRKTSSGKSVTQFSVACKRRGKDAGSDFFECQAWDKTGDYVNTYGEKGREVVLFGRITSREYEKDGIKRKVWEVNVSEVTFIGGVKEKAEAGEYDPFGDE